MFKLAHACVLAVSLAAHFAVAQTPGKNDPGGNDEVFRYRGADRDARLAERAKPEGSVVVYTSLAPTESRPLAEAFEKKDGVKVELWRALSDKVVQRVVTEAQARRHTVDVIETNGPEMEMLAREKVLAEIHSPYISDLPPEAVQPVAARPQGIGVARGAPHPNAALLFADYVLSPEGQRLFESMGRVPASTKVKSELNNFPFTLIEPATVLEEADKWEKIWNDFFLKK